MPLVQTLFLSLIRYLVINESKLNHIFGTGKKVHYVLCHVDSDHRFDNAHLVQHSFYTFSLYGRCLDYTTRHASIIIQI